MLRDRLLARLTAGQAPDYQRLACEVLGIRGAAPALARTLVEQALVFEDRREHWRRVGERARREAPAAPGVYVFRDWAGAALYVGKAANLRRRLSAHFADRRWRVLPPALARVAAIEWQQVGSEIEALLCEALLIRDLQPTVNIQTAAPTLATRAIPRALVQDVVLLVPSIDSGAAELVAARDDGATMLHRTRRNGADLGRHSRQLWMFFNGKSDGAGDKLAPLVFSWLAGRGVQTTRVNPRDFASAVQLRAQLGHLLSDKGLFAERVIAVR
jgi:predicted GIY-YIG superfamily endonuclease